MQVWQELFPARGREGEELIAKPGTNPVQMEPANKLWNKSGTYSVHHRDKERM